MNRQVPAIGQIVRPLVPVGNTGGRDFVARVTGVFRLPVVVLGRDELGARQMRTEQSINVRLSIEPARAGEFLPFVRCLRLQDIEFEAAPVVRPWGIYER